MGKDSFILYDDYAEQIEFLTDEQAGVLLKAIYAYRHGKPLPAMDSAVNMAFSFIRSQLNRDQDRYTETCEKRRLAGIQGAAARWQTVANDSKCQEEMANDSKRWQTMAKMADNDNDDDNENDNENEGDLSPLPPTPKKKRFIPPAIEEVRAYCEERGNNVSPERFIDYYSSIGWKVGKNSMKDWRAAVRTWERKETPKQEQETTEPRKTAYFWEGD